MFNVPWVLPKYCNSGVFGTCKSYDLHNVTRFGKPPKCVIYDHLYIYMYIYPLAFMGNAVHEFMLAFGSHNPTHHGEKSFTSDLEMQGSNLRQIEAPCVPQPTTTVSESFLGWNNAWFALHALRNQPNEWEVTGCLPMCPQVKAYLTCWNHIPERKKRNRQTLKLCI